MWGKRNSLTETGWSGWTLTRCSCGPRQTPMERKDEGGAGPAPQLQPLLEGDEPIARSWPSRLPWPWHSGRAELDSPCARSPAGLQEGGLAHHIPESQNGRGWKGPPDIYAKAGSPCGRIGRGVQRVGSRHARAPACAHAKGSASPRGDPGPGGGTGGRWELRASALPLPIILPLPSHIPPSMGVGCSGLMGGSHG